MSLRGLGRFRLAVWGLQMPNMELRYRPQSPKTRPPYKAMGITGHSMPGLGFRVNNIMPGSYPQKNPTLMTLRPLQ